MCSIFSIIFCILVLCIGWRVQFVQLFSCHSHCCIQLLCVKVTSPDRTLLTYKRKTLHGVRDGKHTTGTTKLFNFRQPDDWPKWKRCFDQYRVSSGLAEKAELRQVSTLLYCLGEEAKDVLASANLTEAAQKEYASVIQCLDRFFKVRQNVIYERARFNRRDQQPGETVERYITALYSPVETCNYGELKEEMLCDRLVVGIADLGLSERLQLDPDLALEKAKKIV